MERTKAPFKKPEISSGPGIPMLFWPFFEKKAGPTPTPSKAKPSKKERNDFSEFAAKLNLEEYNFNDEDVLDPSKANLSLDVTALDLYNDDIRKYRMLVVEECQQISNKPNLDAETLAPLSKAIVRLCRCTFYGTVKSQTLAEGALPLLVWLLNRKHFPDSFLVTVLRGISEMCWTSLRIKQKLVSCFGVRVLFRTMRFLPSNKRIATWACYTLAMAATGSYAVILEAKNILGMEELVGEISFEMYWYDWPANFGMILQAILYGPHSVSSNDELFQFL